MFGNKRKSRRSAGFRKREIKVVNKPVYENPYFHKKKHGIILRLISKPRNIILALIAGGLIYLFFYSTYFVIAKVDLAGNQELTYDTVRFEVNRSFVERRFLIFRQSNFFMFDTDEAKQRLWDAFVLDEISITKRFPNKLIIELKEKIPNLTLITEKAFYYMDLQGVVTHIVPEAEIKQSFPKVEDLNKRVIKLKERVISAELVNAVIIIKDKFKDKVNVDIDRFLIPETTCGTKSSKESDRNNNDTNNLDNTNNSNNNTNVDRAKSNTNSSINSNTNINASAECNLVQAVQDIAVLTTEGWRAYLTVNDDIATQLERLKVYLQKKSPTAESRENIEYIDLRFGEKIYIME
jgi:cell division septal protein FtsQ